MEVEVPTPSVCSFVNDDSALSIVVQSFLRGDIDISVILFSTNKVLGERSWSGVHVSRSLPWLGMVIVGDVT